MPGITVPKSSERGSHAAQSDRARLATGGAVAVLLVVRVERLWVEHGSRGATSPFLQTTSPISSILRSATRWTAGSRSRGLPGTRGVSACVGPGPGEGESPGLRRRCPDLRDGKTYQLRLRQNLRSPNGTPIQGLRLQALDRAGDPPTRWGQPRFTRTSSGAEQFGKPRRGGISGIVVRTRPGTSPVHLVKPRGSSPTNLAIPFAACTRDHPSKNQTPHTTAGGRSLRDQERAAGAAATRLVKNPHFSRAEGHGHRRRQVSGRST